MLWSLYVLYGVAIVPAAVVAIGLRLRALRVQGAVFAAHRPSRPWRVAALVVVVALSGLVITGYGLAPAAIDLGLLSATGTVIALRPFSVDRVCGTGGVRLGTRVAAWERLESWQWSGGRLVVTLGGRSAAFELPRGLIGVLRQRLDEIDAAHGR